MGILITTPPDHPAILRVGHPLIQIELFRTWVEDFVLRSRASETTHPLFLMPTKLNGRTGLNPVLITCTVRNLEAAYAIDLNWSNGCSLPSIMISATVFGKFATCRSIFNGSGDLFFDQEVIELLQEMLFLDLEIGARRQMTTIGKFVMQVAFALKACLQDDHEAQSYWGVKELPLLELNKPLEEAFLRSRMSRLGLSEEQSQGMTGLTGFELQHLRDRNRIIEEDLFRLLALLIN